MVFQRIRDLLPGGTWVDVEIFNLRAGGMIRIARDKVQRRKEQDGAQSYYLKNENESLEPQEFENIYVGSKGEEVLKMFSPTKGVYLPINFIYNKLRDLTTEEQKKLDNIQITEEEQKKLDDESDEKKKKKLKEQIDNRIKTEKKKILKTIYGEMYNAYFESKLDADTLNHLIYKVQKNALRLQGGGMDLATKLSLLMVFIIITSVITGWVQYNYFIKPGMEFWSENSGDVIKAKELNLEQAKVETGYYEKYEPEPVEPVPVK